MYKIGDQKRGSNRRGRGAKKRRKRIGNKGGTGAEEGGREDRCRDMRKKRGKTREEE